MPKKTNGKPIPTPSLSDSSSGSCDSELDDNQTLLSMCDSSNITSQDDLSGNSQPMLPQFKVPQSQATSSWSNHDTVSASNTCARLSATCINDEETSDQTLGDIETQAKKTTEDLTQIRALLKNIIKNATVESGSILTQALHDINSNRIVANEESNTATADDDRSTQFQLTFAPSCSEATSIDNSSIVPLNKYDEKCVTPDPERDYPLNVKYPSKHKNIKLKIVSQPEGQHRARYMTEGSRGAVKDESGNGFPTIKLTGYTGNSPVVLQAFISDDNDAFESPHLFYQASLVSNKNSPPSQQRKIQGTIVIEMELPPSDDITYPVDCVGILKERNVDVEQRLLYYRTNGDCKVPTLVKNMKKTSTSCKLVFRAIISSISNESHDLIAFPKNKIVLQVLSDSINCTQPHGLPEICRQSVVDCPCDGSFELFIIGKNFFKSSTVVFKENNLNKAWMKIVQPDKDYLQPNHLIVKVPRHDNAESIKSPIKVQFSVLSFGKESEPRQLTFHPIGTHFGPIHPLKPLESRLIGTAIQSKPPIPSLIKISNSQAEGGFKSNDHGSEVLSVVKPQQNESSLFIILPGGNLSNGQTQILPVVTSSHIMPNVTKPEPLCAPINTTCINKDITSTVVGGAVGIQSQPLRFMVVPQTISNSTVPQTKQQESFALNDLLVQRENQSSHSTITSQTVLTDSQDTTFHERKLKLEMDVASTPLVHRAPEPLPNEPHAKILKSNSPTSSVIIENGMPILNPQFNQLQQIQQDQINQNIQNEIENKIMQNIHQKIQEQQMNQVIQSQVQQMQREQQTQQLERELEISIGQHQLQKLQEERQLMERDLHQIHQQERLKLEKEIHTTQQIQQAIQSHIHQSLCQEQVLDQTLRAFQQDQRIQEKIHLEFQHNLSPSEKQQLENGLQQIQHEQFQSELQKQILEQKVTQQQQLRNDLQILHQEQQLQDIKQAQHQINHDQNHFTGERLMQQDINKSPQIHFNLQENKLMQAVKSPTLLPSETNKPATWQTAPSIFPDSITPSTKIDNFFFGKKSPDAIGVSQSTTFINSSVSDGTNFQSQIDMTYGACNSNGIFSQQSFPVSLHSTPRQNSIESKIEPSQLQNFNPLPNLPSESTSITFHPNNAISINDIECMDISVPTTVCKIPQNSLIESNQMVNTTGFGRPQIIDSSPAVPMSLETNLPPPLPVLNAVETQFLNTETLYSTSLLPDGTTGIAQTKPVHVNNLPMLSNNIFETNILESNSQPFLGEKANEANKLDPQSTFVHSSMLTTTSVTSPMVLGLNQSALQENKATMMDTTISHSNAMDTSFSLPQSSVCMPAGSLLQSTIKESRNHHDQVMKILQNDSDMMKLFHN